MVTFSQDMRVHLVFDFYLLDCIVAIDIKKCFKISQLYIEIMMPKQRKRSRTSKVLAISIISQTESVSVYLLVLLVIRRG